MLERGPGELEAHPVCLRADGEIIFQEQIQIVSGVK